MYYYLDTSPLVALVDFNMTDHRGVVPALRRHLTGLVPEQLVRGLPLVAQDADGNLSSAVVYSVDGDLIELFLLPAPVDIAAGHQDVFEPFEGVYPAETSPTTEIESDFRAQPDLVR
jgi:hypothetical protein